MPRYVCFCCWWWLEFVLHALDFWSFSNYSSFLTTSIILVSLFHHALQHIQLKSGSFATVCRGTHRATNEKVAVKCVLREDLPPNDDAAIYNEVLILSTLKHPLICPLIDFFEEKECYFLGMCWWLFIYLGWTHCLLLLLQLTQSFCRCSNGAHGRRGFVRSYRKTKELQRKRCHDLVQEDGGKCMLLSREFSGERSIYSTRSQTLYIFINDWKFGLAILLPSTVSCYTLLRHIEIWNRRICWLMKMTIVPLNWPILDLPHVSTSLAVWRSSAEHLSLLVRIELSEDSSKILAVFNICTYIDTLLILILDSTGGSSAATVWWTGRHVECGCDYLSAFIWRFTLYGQDSKGVVSEYCSRWEDYCHGLF